MSDIAALITESPLTRPFWDACHQGRLLVPKCSDCGRYFFAPEIACIHCFSTDWQWVESSGRGRLQSYSVVHKAPMAGFATPFVFAVIDMEEGWSLFSNLVDCAEADIRFDMPVAVTFAPVSHTRSLPYFRPRPG